MYKKFVKFTQLQCNLMIVTVYLQGSFFQDMHRLNSKLFSHQLCAEHMYDILIQLQNFVESSTCKKPKDMSLLLG